MGEVGVSLGRGRCLALPLMTFDADFVLCSIAILDDDD